MAKFKLIKLKNLTPIHIGTGKENYDFSSDELKSDTISATLAALRAMHGGTEDLEGFMKSFTISSAFPFWKDSLFLPKVIGKIEVLVEGKEEYQSRKELKKIKYIESSIWNEVVRGNPIIVSDKQLQKEFLISLSDNFRTVSKSAVHQRVTIPRGDAGKTEPFFFEWKFFDPDAGLFCIVDAKDEVFNEILELFKELGHIGFGTDKNIGGGKFEIETNEISLPEIKDATHQMLLSLYIPNEDEMKSLNLQDSKYEITQRGGFMAGSSLDNFRHLRKKSIYMFNVGSCFATTNTLTGKIVNLQPDWNDDNMHPVFRSGKPFYLPVKLRNNE